MPSFVAAIAEIARTQGTDLGSLGLAWARIAPSIVIVPAFGARALPGAARAVLALGMAAILVPSVTPVSSDLPWELALGTELIRGVPVALAATIPLWTASVAGGLIDTLRGSSASVFSPVVEGRTTPLGVPLSMLASALFLTTGGPARLVLALAAPHPGASPLSAAAHNIESGISLAIALAAPLLVAAMVIEVAAALVARAAAPAQVQTLFAPARALAILALFAVVFERVGGILERAVRSVP